MPKLLSQLNYEESKINSKLHIIRQESKSRTWQFCKGCEISQGCEFLDQVLQHHSCSISLYHPRIFWLSWMQSALFQPLQHLSRLPILPWSRGWLTPRPLLLRPEPCLVITMPSSCGFKATWACLRLLHQYLAILSSQQLYWIFLHQ